MIEASGHKLESRWIGAQDASGKDGRPVLVFLHEGLGCIDLWRDFPARLCAETGLGGLVYSRAGYGGSQGCQLPRPIDFMQDEGLVVLPQVLQQSGISRAVLIGHSDGGSIALHYAAGQQAGVVCGLVTLAAHVFNEEICVASIQEAKTAFENGHLRQRLEKYHGDNVDNAFRGWSDVWLHPDFATWNMEDVLPEIKVPTLAVQGNADPYGSLAQVHAIVSGIGDHAQSLVIDDCGHDPHLEKQPELIAAIGKFIRGIIEPC